MCTTSKILSFVSSAAFDVPYNIVCNLSLLNWKSWQVPVVRLAGEKIMQVFLTITITSGVSVGSHLPVLTESLALRNLEQG